MIHAIAFEEAIEEAKRDALLRYPDESCGYILVREGRIVYVAVPNQSPSPKDHFKIDWAIDAEVLAVMHSHPNDNFHPWNGKTYPSKQDMLSQEATGVPWGLLLCNGEVCADAVWVGRFPGSSEMVGRPFVHGVTDCYELIRDWYYYNKSVTLKQFPRDFEWWSGEEDLYEEGYRKAGFTDLVNGVENAEEGDILMFNILSPKINHAAVYLGNGLMLHHLSGRLSAREAVGVYRVRMRKILRYNQ